ncbi:MAG TPA: helix-turn-helix transcriptional regulator [Acidobacteriota bacterium]|nr:helix-turn-helix transcriptional regulator [Acidobacteriota bacterium]
MKPAHFHILVALAARDLHGAEIKREVLRLSQGELTLWPTTLYSSLDELASRQWIEELDHSPGGASERRRYYRISDTGREAMAQETRRLSKLVEAACRHNPVQGEEA